MKQQQKPMEYKELREAVRKGLEDEEKVIFECLRSYKENEIKQSLLNEFVKKAKEFETSKRFGDSTIEIGRNEETNCFTISKYVELEEHHGYSTLLYESNLTSDDIDVNKLKIVCEENNWYTIDLPKQAVLKCEQEERDDL